jgi:hypothetical protein
MKSSAGGSGSTKGGWRNDSPRNRERLRRQPLRFEHLELIEPLRHDDTLEQHGRRHHVREVEQLIEQHAAPNHGRSSVKASCRNTTVGTAGSTAIVAALGTNVPPMRTVQRRLR